MWCCSLLSFVKFVANCYVMFYLASDIAAAHHNGSGTIISTTIKSFLGLGDSTVKIVKVTIIAKLSFLVNLLLLITHVLRRLC